MAENDSHQSNQTTNQTNQTTQVTNVIRPVQRPGMVYIQDSVDQAQMIKRGRILNEDKK